MVMLPKAATAPRSRRQRRFRLWGSVAGVLTLSGAGLWWTLGQPVVYRARCVLDYGREPVSVAVGAIPAARGLESEEWYRTQDFLLTSNSVLERVVQELRLDKDRAFLELAPNEPSANMGATALQKLRDRLTISSVDGTHLAQIEARDPNPQRAALVANALAEAYMKRAAEERLASTQQAFAWLGEQVDATRRRLAATDDELQAYLAKRETPAVSLEERQEMVTAEIRQLNQLITDARVRRIQLGAKLAKLKSAAQHEDPFEIHAVEFDQDEQVKQLRTDHLALVLRQRELEASQDDSSQPALLNNVKLEAVRKEMQVAVNGIVASAQEELTAAQQVESQLQTALQRANSEGRELQLQQLEYGRLARDRAETETLLKALRDRSAAAGIATGASTANIVERATPPSTPISRVVVRNVGLRALLSTLLAPIFGRLT